MAEPSGHRTIAQKLHALRFDRPREIDRMRRWLERAHWPRVQMMGIVALTGAGGFFASFLLLFAGMTSMTWRYPLAVTFAYALFLFLLWCWLQPTTRDVASELSDEADIPGRLADTALDIADAGYGPAADADTGGGVDAVDALGAADGEGLILIGIIALLVAAAAALTIVFAAPMLLAELLVDIALASGLYRRVRGIAGDHWIATAIKRTAWRYVVTALLFSLAGSVMHHYAPDAVSIGGAFAQWRGGDGT